MHRYSRRDFLYISAALFFTSKVPSFALQRRNEKFISTYPVTIEVLKKAFHAEMVAHKHYIEYTQKALIDEYPNIAYLFHAFSCSEKIHADNYKSSLLLLGKKTKSKQIELQVQGTKSNLRAASRKEMDKINNFYPGIIKELEKERCEEAIINCMYAWKSHQQHEKEIRRILRFSGLFFGLVTKEIERKKPNFFVCGVCGSTIDERPLTPCIICNMSAKNYRKLARPILATE
jgi:rubrerythrin